MKSLARHGVIMSLLAVVALSMTGCPVSPSLSVQPASLVLSDVRTDARITIANEGSGTLNWVAETTHVWLSLADDDENAVPTQRVSGSTRQNAFLRVFLNTALLPEDREQVRGAVMIESNGGSREIVVAIERVRTPLLALEPDTLDFGDTETQLVIEVVNRGDAVLQWNSAIPAGVDWLTISPDAGSVLRQSATAVTVRINRGRLVPAAAPYVVDLEFLSNGGDQSLAVSVLAPAFTANRQNLEFGVLTQPGTQDVQLTTPSSDPVPLTVVVSDDEWLEVNANNFSVTRTNPYNLRVTANPVGLAIGDYSATIEISHAATDRIVTIPVLMTVGAPVSFRLDPDTLDFGETREVVQLTTSLINEGDDPIAWRIEKPEAATWLELSAEDGQLDDTASVTITANATDLQPRTYSVNLVVYAGGVSRVLRVSLTRVADPIADELQVEPQHMDFGNLLNRLDINIWNEGPGEIDWAIDGAALPAWLAISPLSGTVSGAITQVVRVSVDRDFMPEDADEEQHLFEISSSVAGAAPVEVRVAVKAQRFPQIEIVGEGTDANNVPFVVINIGEDSDIFIIRNTGRAVLFWNVDLTGMPNWITSVTPQQGELRPNREQQVRITTNREGLTQAGGSHRFLVRSNDPDMPLAPVDISVLVPYSIIIGARPGTLNFGRNLSSLPFEVANLGDAGFPLDFVITSNHPEWIFVEPQRGRSIGTAGATKDWQFISVAIDRGRITQGATAKLLIQAENVPPNALPVEPVEIEIIFDISELNIEMAIPRWRAPSLLRFNMLLRDAAQRIFPGYEDDPTNDRSLYRLSTLQAQILENSIPLELTETNLFVKKDESLSFSVLVLLDYSASMAVAAEELVVDGQLNPGGLAPLDALYIQTVGEMLQEFPDHYKVGLAVFNERRPWWHASIRMITGAPNLGDPRARDAFVSDKDILQYRIENTDVVEYGATPLWDAVLEATMRLYNLDRTLPDFDKVAERILVAVTDGRVTTPPGTAGPLISVLEAARVRFFPIGFGKTVLANSLIQLSAGSGGHYYSTDNKVIPGSFDPNGDPVTIPILESLLDRCRTNPVVSDAHSLPRDLGSHVTLSYVTLNEMSSMSVQGRIEVEEVDPSVRETFIVTGIPSFSFANDTKLGQIGLRTDGIQSDNSAEIRMYADYIPRNIRRLQFEITTTPAQGWDVALIAARHGGLVADWNLTRNGNIITLETATNRPLAYGDYGNLVDIIFSGVAGPFRLDVTVLDPVIDGTADGKYFTIPRGMDVTFGPFTAFSFPNPEFEFAPTFNAPRSNIIDVNSADPPATLLVHNVGGEHLPTLAALYWRVAVTPGYLGGTVPLAVDFAYDGVAPIDDDFYLVHPELNGLGVLGVADSGTFMPLIPVDGNGDMIPGVYSTEFYIDVYYGSLFLLYQHGPYYLRYTVN